MLQSMRRYPVRAAMLGALFLAAAWVGWFVSYRISAEPVPEWDASERLNELVESRQPDGENAWPIYARILQDELGINIDNDTQAGNRLFHELIYFTNGFSHYQYSEWRNPSLSRDRERFEGFRHLLRHLDEAADAPGFSINFTYPRDGESPHRVLLPGLSHLVSLYFLNHIGLQIATVDEDWCEVARRFRTARSMRRHLTFLPSMWSWNLSAVMQFLTNNEMTSILMTHDVPADACERMLEAIEDLKMPASPLRMMYEGERILASNNIQWLYTPGEEGFMTYRGLLRLRLNSSIDPLNTMFFDRVDAPFLERTADLHPRMIAMPRRGDTQHAVDSAYDAINDYLIGGSSTFDSLRTTILDSARGNPFAEIAARTRIEFLPLLEFQVTLQQAMEIMLRLELSHSRTGRWPDTLDDVMSTEQSIDPVSGLAIRYERTPADPAGRPYLLLAPEPYPYEEVVPDWPVLNSIDGPDTAETEPTDQ